MFLVFYEYKQHTMNIPINIWDGEYVPAYLQDVFGEVELLGLRIQEITC